MQKTLKTHTHTYKHTDSKSHKMLDIGTCDLTVKLNMFNWASNLSQFCQSNRNKTLRIAHNQSKRKHQCFTQGSNTNNLAKLSSPPSNIGQ